jgi:hypothetical protein
MMHMFLIAPLASGLMEFQSEMPNSDRVMDFLPGGGGTQNVFGDGAVPDEAKTKVNGSCDRDDPPAGINTSTIFSVQPIKVDDDACADKSMEELTAPQCDTDIDSSLNASTPPPSGSQWNPRFFPNGRSICQEATEYVDLGNKMFKTYLGNGSSALGDLSYFVAKVSETVKDRAYKSYSRNSYKTKVQRMKTEPGFLESTARIVKDIAIKFSKEVTEKVQVKVAPAQFLASIEFHFVPLFIPGVAAYMDMNKDIIRANFPNAKACAPQVFYVSPETKTSHGLHIDSMFFDMQPFHEKFEQVSFHMKLAGNGSDVPFTVYSDEIHNVMAPTKFQYDTFMKENITDLERLIATHGFITTYMHKLDKEDQQALKKSNFKMIPHWYLTAAFNKVEYCSLLEVNDSKYQGHYAKLEAGEAVVFDNYKIHGSLVPHNNGSRYTLNLRCTGPEVYASTWDEYVNTYPSRDSGFSEKLVHFYEAFDCLLKVFKYQDRTDFFNSTYGVTDAIGMKDAFLDMLGGRGIQLNGTKLKRSREALDRHFELKADFFSGELNLTESHVEDITQCFVTKLEKYKGGKA